MNQRIADAFITTFSDNEGLVVPVVPTFGNNDIYPHNILEPGPNKILSNYNDIWETFIPEDQRHSFQYGGWFYVEVIPDKLAVFSLNTLYFFDRNAGVDDCAHPTEPGYQQFEWLRVQLQFLRERGLKAILIGHVPPARTSGKQLWEETCWQKYTLWLQQYRDVVVSSLYGHMNIDHFFLQDTNEIDISFIGTESSQQINTRESMDEEFSVESSKDYLMELRENWATLPDPVADKDLDESGKKKHKDKIGGPWAERYQLTLVSPSIVPNYFPTLRVFEYNITGIENTQTWVDKIRASEAKSSSFPEDLELPQLELRSESDIEIEKKKKKKKGKHGKYPKLPKFNIPEPPAKGSPPGPAYFPQPLTLKGFTQYYANLTYINNDITKDSNGEDGWLALLGWNPGKHKDKKPKHDKPKPREFSFEVEYTTFDDKIYKLNDLTVKSLLRLAHRIGQTSGADSIEPAKDYERKDDRYEDDDVDNKVEDVESYDEEDEVESDDELEDEKKKKKKGKGKKKKHKGGSKKKATKIWLHFLKHAFVSTRSIDELKDLQ
ncbi:Endopolyphosphatase [Hypoxylon sp. NC0597]|nr:Endopolyphosphatase [Hypoxylon sp. NC0597]